MDFYPIEIFIHIYNHIIFSLIKILASDALFYILNKASYGQYTKSRKNLL